MKCMNVKGLEAYQVKKFLKKLEKSLRTQRLEGDEKVWERKQRSIKREIERNEGRITRGSINRPSINLNR